MQIRRSVASTARRAQIVAATIDCLAEIGYARTSFSQISARAALSSPRLISYHFGSRDGLMRAVVEEVFDQARAAIDPRMADAVERGGPGEQIGEFVRASIDWYVAAAVQLRALREVWNNLREADGRLALTTKTHEPEYRIVSSIFADGQALGVFRTFDTRVMAVALRSILDGAAEQLAVDADLDPRAYADELVGLLDAATRATPVNREVTP